jgi:hypothetical protein
MNTFLHRLSLRGLAALALAATCSLAAGAQTNTAPTAVTKKGAIVDAKITTGLSSKTSKNGDPFSMIVTDSFFHTHRELKGAVIDGHVESVTPAGPTHKATMSIIFDDITFPNGDKEPISVAVNKMSQLEPKTHHIRDIGIIIGGAVAGHMVSKKTGAGGGTLAGAAAGFVLVNTLKDDITIKPGTIIQLKLQQDLPDLAPAS